MDTRMNLQKVLMAGALLAALASTSCGGGTGFTTPSLGSLHLGSGSTTHPSGGTNTPVNGSEGETFVSGNGGTGGTSNSNLGHGDTQLNIPGGGGGGGTQISGSGYSPEVTVPPVETYVDKSSAGDDDVTRWLKNLVETLPNPNSGNSSVFQNESLQNWAYAIFDQVNQQRQAAGLQPLEYETHLETLAQAHARDMGLRDFFSHDCPDGVLMWDRWQAMKVPYTNWAGENAAMGQETAAEVVNEWMASPGHHANMMHDSARYCGVGVYFDAGDASMPIKVIMEYADFRDDPATHAWYERGDVYRK